MTDKDDNAADFDTGSPNPRNSVTVGINGNPEVTVPARFVLLQIYPNPFNPSTTIGFRIAETAWVRLDVCDPLGRVAAILVNELKTPGAYLATFDASGLSTGAYFCRLIAGTSVHTRRMLLLRRRRQSGHPRQSRSRSGASGARGGKRSSAGWPPYRSNHRR